jgi:amino acid adenylation domain-containing protein
MSLQDVFDAIQEKNIVIREREGELVVLAPQGAMDQAFIDRLKSYKQDLLIALRNGSAVAEQQAADPKITPDMLPLADLTQDDIDAIVSQVAEGAAGIQDIYPLSPLQEGILFHHLLETQGDPYITRSLLAFDGRRDLNAFLDALQTVIDRHDILRSSVHWHGLPQPVQVVHRRAVLPVEELAPAPSGQGRQRLWERTDPRQLRLDLRQAPLMAGYVIKDSGSERCWFALLNHHLINDHQTLQLILSEIRQVLDGRGGQLPAVQPYRNFIARMRAVPQAEHENYFRRELGDMDETTAPFGVPNVRRNGGQVGESVLSLPADLAQRLRNGAGRHGVTPASLFHLIWALVISQCSGRDDVVFGTVLFGRLRGDNAGADTAVGMFINTLPIRVSLRGRTVSEAVARTQRGLNELLMHEHASLALAQRCSAVPASAPLFTALLNYRHSTLTAAPDQPVLLEWEGMRVIDSEERSNYPLTLSVDDLGLGFGLSIQCAAGIDPQRIAGYLNTAMEGVITALEQDPQRLATDIGIMPAAERRQVLFDFNATVSDEAAEQSLHALFEKQVEKTPDADAVAFAGRTLSYAELNARANRLAHYLRARGVGPEVPVGLCVERSPEMVVGMLGILKAGGAYVPLDPHYPEQRIAYMLQDLRIALLLTRQGLAPAVPDRGTAIVYLDNDWPAIAQCREDNLAPCNHPLDLAYIIYTSGSTGQPKGVMVSHRNAVNSTVARFAIYREPVSAYLLLSSFAFDSSVAGLFWTLGQGGCLCLPEDGAAKDPVVVGELIATRKVSHLLALPSFYALLLKHAGARLQTLKTAIVAGEACAAEVAKQHYATLPEVPLYNEYGPTEGSVWSSVYRAARLDLDRPLSIGRPVGNVRLHILDRSGNPVPVGVQGELHIGGAGVARGYWRHPGLTAERFIPDPFHADGGRLYRTGDLARYRADGNIEFLGRIDHQVKIRGFRIELGEIEARLLEQPGVEEAVVCAREDRPGEKRLAAYIVGGNAMLTDAVLRDAMKECLPDYMQPSAYAFLDGLPVTANGKVNRQALLPPERYGKAADKRDGMPDDPMEQALAHIWMEILGMEAVGADRNFFDLGGHSLSAIQMVSRIQEHFGVELAVEDIFRKPTIRQLAELILEVQLGQLDDGEIATLLEEIGRLGDETSTSKTH